MPGNRIKTLLALDLESPEGSPEMPRLVREAGPAAVLAYETFLDGKHSPRKSPHTHRAYSSSVHRFLLACECQGLDLRAIRQLHVSRYLDQYPGEAGRKNRQLAALRAFFDELVTAHAIARNPAASLAGFKKKREQDRGTPPRITPAQQEKLLGSIVGIGASAGGLEAFIQLLTALPADTGMAFVLVQHLPADHSSALAEILSRATSMPVTEVQDEPEVEPNHVYVIPPGRNMVISRGKLGLLPREARGHPIDQFFRTLAKDRGDQAIGVVLSGGATDGTLGLEAIKAEGGLTFAQDTTAKHESMPRSAIASGCVDFVLPPDEIGKEIARIARHPYATPESKRETDLGESNLVPILRLLHRATGVDFTNYRTNTLYRRVTRRMVLGEIQDLGDYVRFLEATPAEVEALYQDILIGVTSFFRDPEAIEALKETVFPSLINDRPRNQPVRAWVLGCSSGEEAYSLAIAFREAAEKAGSLVPLQLFASDLNAAGIEKARVGVYPKAIAQDVWPERLRRFFVEVDGSYRIAKEIRDSCIFSRHNVLADPPFCRMDFVSCRNFLIYLEPVLQRRVLPILHYALQPGGFLWLGGSETIGSARDLFDVEDPRHKIYARKPVHFPLHLTESSPLGFKSSGPPEPRAADLNRAADRFLLARYAPPGVLISRDLEILQFRGDTSPYLAPAPGKPSHNILKMAREGLLVPLRGAILQAQKEGRSVRAERLVVRTNGGYRETAVAVMPIPGDGAGEGAFLVLFEEPRGPAIPPRADEPPAAPADRRAGDPETARLAQELAQTRECLQSLIEKHEASTEELQSANQEVQSANEELQSINEELETSKEEIQSSNQELATVNEELRNRNQELNQVNNDLQNLFASVHMAIIMVGQDLRLRRFTPLAEKLWNLVPTDLGRALGDLKLKIDVPDLESLLIEAIDTVTPKDLEVQDKEGHGYSLRLRPYMTSDKRIDGAVVILVDVDELRRAREYAQSIVATVREPLVVLGPDLRVKTASRAFYEVFRVSPEETERRLFYDLGNGQWDIPELRRLLEEILPKSNVLDGFEVENDFMHLGRRVVQLNACMLRQDVREGPLILLAIEDVTEGRRLASDIEKHCTELALADQTKNEFLAMLAHELRNPLAPLRNAVEVLRTADAGADAHGVAQAMLGRQVHHLSRMIDDLLDVSRITRGRIGLQKERLDLVRVLDEALASIRHHLEGREQEMSISQLPGPVYVEGDPTRLDQVFGNLLNNASKFSRRGSRIWVTVEPPARAAEPGEAVVRVRDEGIGIAKDMLPRVFDLFTQADSSFARTYGGLGIGLTLVRNLVELHGGSVEARSEGVGRGSEFVVRLPVLPEGQQITVKARLSPPSSRGVKIRRRILVVDDHADAAASMAMILRLERHDVRVAHDGPGALEAAAAFEPEIVLLDIGLPEMDGYEVARSLRKIPRLKKALVVALTGYGKEEDKRRALDAGFDEHLTKPVDLQVLKELLIGRAGA